MTTHEDLMRRLDDLGRSIDRLNSINADLLAACKASVAAFDRGDKAARPHAEHWADLRAAAETARAAISRNAIARAEPPKEKVFGKYNAGREC